MFEMKVEKQLNIADRSLILGIPSYDSIPKVVSAANEKINVIGVSLGAKPPFMSLEIEKISFDLVGKTVKAI